MAYTPTTWVNNSLPALNATNLNKIENGISTVATNTDTNTSNIGTLSNLTTTNKTSLVNAINELNASPSIITGGEEVRTGRVIDGYDEYVKRVFLDNFPNANTEKTWATGINMTNIVITNLSIIVKTGSLNWFSLPNNDTVNSRVSLNNDGNIHVTIYTGNLTGNNGYAEISYYHTS